MVQTSGPFSGQVLAKASLAGYVIPNVRGLMMGQGISVTSAGPIQATSQIIGNISGKVKTVGLVAGQVVASELFPVAMLPGSVAEVQTPNEGKFQE
jgi:hypothetical protein